MASQEKVRLQLRSRKFNLVTSCGMFHLARLKRKARRTIRKEEVIRE
jgi:hypothetical protein